MVFPKVALWENYVLAWTMVHFGKYLVNSVVLTLFYALPCVMSSCFAGYAFSRFQVRESKAVFLVVLSTLMIPAMVTIMPLYMIMAKIGLANQRRLWLLFGLQGIPFIIFLFRQFFSTIPMSFEESARMDGAGRFQIFFYIMFPLVQTGVIVAAIFAFQWSWSEFLQPMLFLSDEKLTLAVKLARGYVDQKESVLYHVGHGGHAVLHPADRDPVLRPAAAVHLRPAGRRAEGLGRPIWTLRLFPHAGFRVLLSDQELALARGLDAPEKVQAFLSTEVAYNFEPEGTTAYGPVEVLHRRTAHCFEGAIFAAALLWFHGWEPLLVLLEAPRDFDHNLIVYRRDGRWGSVSQSRHEELRGKPAVLRLPARAGALLPPGLLQRLDPRPQRPDPAGLLPAHRPARLRAGLGHLARGLAPVLPAAGRGAAGEALLYRPGGPLVRVSAGEPLRLRKALRRNPAINSCQG